ncbi:MAG: flavodoxin [Gammaproteobacteria bacterium]|nr:flavodoxin [Gammaproteobacteria bacterium]
MKIAIRYFTKSKKGNTVKLANYVSNKIGIEALDVTNELKEDTDRLLLINAMYAADIDAEVKEFLEKNASKIKCLININSSATGLSTLKAVKKVASKYNIPVSEKEYHTVGSFMFMNKNRPNDDDLNRLGLFIDEVLNG